MTDEPNVFAQWVQAMGANGKQIGKTAELAGILAGPCTKLHRGILSANKLKLMAMAAAAAGLEPWSPETHSECLVVKDVLTTVRKARGAHNEEIS